jgi:trehalose-6-phosphate synthase
MARLIVVSNRVALPDQRAPSGGLAVGVLAALKSAQGGIWFGWSGKTQETPALEPVVVEHEGIQFMTVDLPTASFNAYYDGFCNSSLWPLHHYFPGAFRYDATEYDAYLAVNHHYASGLIEIVKNDDLVWIHDYQLIPLGRMLREAGIKARIGFFLHIPYPNIAVLRLLPPYEDLVRDMCQYDLVGFQTAEDRDGFQSAVRAVFEQSATIGAGSSGHRTARWAGEPTGAKPPRTPTALRRGSAGLQQRFDRAFQLLSSASQHHPRITGKYHLRPDCPIEQDQRSSVRGHSGCLGTERRSHQWPIRGCRLDPDPIFK